MTGAEVAAAGTNPVCEAALAAGYLCPTTAPCPCTATGAGGFFETFAYGATPGFDLFKAAGDPKFLVAPTVPGDLNALNHNTNAGNSIGTDPLPTYMVRVDKGAVDGVVNFSVKHFQGGADPRTFNVDTTGLNDLALHQAIETGFEGLGLGLDAIVHPATEASSYSFAPEALNGYFVELSNTAVKTGRQDHRRRARGPEHGGGDRRVQGGAGHSGSRPGRHAPPDAPSRPDGSLDAPSPAQGGLRVPHTPRGQEPRPPPGGRGFSRPGDG